MQGLTGALALGNRISDLSGHKDQASDMIRRSAFKRRLSNAESMVSGIQRVQHSAMSGSSWGDSKSDYSQVKVIGGVRRSSAMRRSSI
jgi:hypothetical protein